jgi:hypothetical protein
VDGTEPTDQSQRYDQPLKITSPVTVKATPFFGCGIPGRSSSLVVRPVDRLNAIANPPSLQPGLNYAYYEGRWDRLPDFEKLVPVVTGTVPELGLKAQKRPEDFGFRFSGYLDVPKDGLYTFYLTSDDGSRLLIDDQLIVDNDGLHGDIEQRGQVFLQKGKHRLVLPYFQQAGGANLRLKFETAGIRKWDVSPRALFHAE